MLQKPARWLPFVTWFPLMSLGFYIGRKFPSTWDVGVFIFTTEMSAVILLFYLCVWDLLWKAYLGQIDTTPVLGKKEPDPTPIPVNVNGIKAGEVYSHIVEAPRFDLERHAAVIILRQLEMGDAPDFREATWVQRGKHNKFSTRSEFIAVLEKWKRLHAIDRAADRKNSSYVVTDERVIRLIANGERFE